jgi:hypothetical protein
MKVIHGHIIIITLQQHSPRNYDSVLSRYDSQSLQKRDKRNLIQ